MFGLGLLLMVVGGVSVVILLAGTILDLCDHMPFSREKVGAMAVGFIVFPSMFFGGLYAVNVADAAEAAKPAPPKIRYDVECFSGGVRVFSRNGVEDYKSQYENIYVDSGSPNEVRMHGATCVARRVQPAE